MLHKGVLNHTLYYGKVSPDDMISRYTLFLRDSVSRYALYTAESTRRHFHFHQAKMHNSDSLLRKVGEVHAYFGLDAKDNTNLPDALAQIK